MCCWNLQFLAEDPMSMPLSCCWTPNWTKSSSFGLCWMKEKDYFTGPAGNTFKANLDTSLPQGQIWGSCSSFCLPRPPCFLLKSSLPYGHAGVQHPVSKGSWGYSSQVQDSAFLEYQKVPLCPVAQPVYILFWRSAHPCEDQDCIILCRHWTWQRGICPFVQVTEE